MALTRDKLFWDGFTEHGKRAVAVSTLLLELVRDPTTVEEITKKVHAVERGADDVTHNMMSALHQTWITPLDRDSIHELISKLDDVLDFIDAAAERIVLYEIREVRPEAREMARTLTASCVEMQKGVAALTKIKNPQAILDVCVTINKYENEADGIFRSALARLFKEGGDPLDVMKWRDIFESLEIATDRLEDVANIIEGIVLEHA